MLSRRAVLVVVAMFGCSGPALEGSVPEDRAVPDARSDTADVGAEVSPDVVTGGLDAAADDDATRDTGTSAEDTSSGADALSARDAPVAMDVSSGADAATRRDAPMIDGPGRADVPATDASGCATIWSASGLVFVSEPGALRRQIPIPQGAPTTWSRIEVSLDVLLAGWTPHQGQYEVFSLLRGRRWVSGAIGYIAFGGPATPQTVMVANLDLPGAAAPDGRRVTRRYGYAAGRTYHLDYAYDAARNERSLRVRLDGAEVTSLAATTTVSRVSVPSEGFLLILGGEEVPDAPDSSTEHWRFSDVTVRGCR